MSDDIVVIHDNDEEEEEEEGEDRSQPAVDGLKKFVWPMRKKHRHRPSNREEELLLAPPLHVRPSLAQAHFGACVVGQGAHPAAHLFEVLEHPSCKVERTWCLFSCVFASLNKRKKGCVFGNAKRCVARACAKAR